MPTSGVRRRAIEDAIPIFVGHCSRQNVEERIGMLADPRGPLYEYSQNLHCKKRVVILDRAESLFGVESQAFLT